MRLLHCVGAFARPIPAAVTRNARHLQVVDITSSAPSPPKIALALTLTFATLNIRGFTRAAKQAEVLKLARQKRIDVLALQETYIRSPKRSDPALRRTIQHQVILELWEARVRGVALLFLRDTGLSVLRHAHDNDGRIVSVDLNNGIRIINNYAPSRYGQGPFFKSLEDKMVGPARVILAGDFNCVLHPEDRRSPRGTPRRLGRDYRGARRGLEP